jgi:hypothetical protein
MASAAPRTSAAPEGLVYSWDAFGHRMHDMTLRQVTAKIRAEGVHEVLESREPLPPDHVSDVVAAVQTRDPRRFEDARLALVGGDGTRTTFLLWPGKVCVVWFPLGGGHSVIPYEIMHTGTVADFAKGTQVLGLTTRQLKFFIRSHHLIASDIGHGEEGIDMTTHVTGMMEDPSDLRNDADEAFWADIGPLLKTRDLVLSAKLEPRDGRGLASAVGTGGRVRHRSGRRHRHANMSISSRHGVGAGRGFLHRLTSRHRRARK